MRDHFSIKMFSSILKVFPLGVHAHESLLRQDARGQLPAVDATGVQPRGVFVLLKSSVGVVTEEHRLGPVPESRPRPVVEELARHGTVG